MYQLESQRGKRKKQKKFEDVMAGNFQKVVIGATNPRISENNNWINTKHTQKSLDTSYSNLWKPVKRKKTSEYIHRNTGKNYRFCIIKYANQKIECRKKSSNPECYTVKITFKIKEK